jgi:hypothetical protein
LPFGVIVSSFMGREGVEKCIPLRRFFLDVKVEVVGVCGGEDGPACWANLRLGVDFRMAALLIVVIEWQIGGVF